MSASEHPPLPSPLVEEGPGWLSLEKDSGLPCFPPHADPEGDCLWARLLRARPAQGALPWPEGFAGGIAHRLDVATSGLVLAATSPDDLVRLRQAFSGHHLRKRYLFLTRRDVPWDEHRVEVALAHDKHRKARMVVQRGQQTPHRGHWLPARTRLRRLARLDSAEGALHLWEAVIDTGVMHQVRIHAAFAGLALAGDRLYGGGEPTPWARAHAPQAPPFHLHHHVLWGPALAPRPLPAPAWWPELPAAALALPARP